MGLKSTAKNSSNDPDRKKSSKQLLGGREFKSDLPPLPTDKSAVKKTSGISGGIHKHLIRELSADRAPNTYEVIIGAAELIRKGPREPIAMALKRCKGQQEVVRIYTEYTKTGKVPSDALGEDLSRPFTIF